MRKYKVGTISQLADLVSKSRIRFAAITPWARARKGLGRQLVSLEFEKFLRCAANEGSFRLKLEQENVRVASARYMRRQTTYRIHATDKISTREHQGCVRNDGSTRILSDRRIICLSRLDTAFYSSTLHTRSAARHNLQSNAYNYLSLRIILQTE